MSRKILPTVLLLSPFIFTFAFALDIYVPSIPTIHTYFSTSPFVIQLTVSLFILMTGVGQLFIGPLSDHFGRRWIVIAGALTFLLGSVVATLSPNVVVLIVARVIEGAGACSMMVATFAIVRDLFAGDECARMYSFLNSTISLSPLLAPIMGGYLAEFYGWRSAFVFLSVMAGFVLLLALIKMKETLTEENEVKLSKQLFVNYFQIIKERKFQIYTFAASAGFASFLTFFSVSSYIIIDLLGVPKQHFGFYFAAIGVAFFFSSLLSGYLSEKIGTYQTVLLGTLLMTLAGIVMLLWYVFFGLSVYGFMGPMMIMGLGGAFLMGGGAGGAIEPFPAMAGAASALFGCCEFVFAFIVSTMVLEWKVASSMPLAWTLIVMGALSFLFCVTFYKQLSASKPVSD